VLAGCGADPGRPTEALPTGDGGPRPERDAGPGGQDGDHDGFALDHDCDDSNPEVSPAAFDVPGNAVDEDCDGVVLTQPVTCDGPLAADSDEPDDAARALGLCSFATQISRSWGVRDADWKLIDEGSELEDPRQVWLPNSFGAVTPREGNRLFMMSTGVARDADAEDFTPECDAFSSTKEDDENYSNGVAPPEPYPVDSTLCPETSLGSDGSMAFNDVGLELRIRVPSNAHSLVFDSIFLTHEYPDFVCSSYNDFFVVFMTPTPKGGPDGRDKDDKNVVFDSRGNPVGVNTALLTSCRQSGQTRRDIPCEQGPALLAGTGFDQGEALCGVTTNNQKVGGASTGWLRTSVPVEPRDTVTLHFLLWDSQDPNLDSTVGIDNLHFETAGLDQPTTGPITSAP
jgi:hypothetical protein